MKDYSLGIPDADFIRGKVPMSKQEVRILTLAKARIKTKDNIIDIGAGTGSLTIEAAFLANEGHVWAIEKNPEAIELLQENTKKFERDNITLLAGCAPEVMPPTDIFFDVVLIGGSGGKLVELFTIIDKQLQVGGRIVINAVTLETLADCTNLMKKEFLANYSCEVICVQVTRLNEAGTYNIFNALNPVYIFSARKIQNKKEF